MEGFNAIFDHNYVDNEVYVVECVDQLNSGNEYLIGKATTSSKPDCEGAENSSIVANFSWSKEATKLLIQEYKNLKERFRDPKTKKKGLWTLLRKEFEKKGHNVSEDILDRKWRNLKKTYTTVKDNTTKTGRGRISWEHFDDFNDIYMSDKTVNLPEIISSKLPPDTGVEIAIPETLVQSGFDNYALLSPSSSTSASDKSTTRNSSKRSSGMYYLRKRQADIEEKRVEEIRLLRQALERNNTLHEERNMILRKLIEKST